MGDKIANKVGNNNIDKKVLIIGIILFITLVCGVVAILMIEKNNSLEMYKLLNAGQDIEINLTTPEYNIDFKGEKEETSLLTRVQLDKLETYNRGFRQSFDDLFHINIIRDGNEGGKSGSLFVIKDSSGVERRSGNTSLKDAFRNKAFVNKYFKNSDVTTGLAKLAEMVYADTDVNSSNALYASINAYYNLGNEGKDNTSTYFNATQSLSREDFYTLVYMTENGVKDKEELETDNLKDFQTQVADESEKSYYASQVEEYAFLNSINKGLRKGNYKESITRAEAIYMLMNMNFSEQLKNMNVKEIKLIDAINGGDMLGGKDILYSTNKDTKEKDLAEGWQLGVIAKMQSYSQQSKDGKAKVQEDIYKALGLAADLDLIQSETRWNEPISKVEAIELITKVHLRLNEVDGFLTTREYGYIDESKAGEEDKDKGDSNSIQDKEGDVTTGESNTGSKYDEIRNQLPEHLRPYISDMEIKELGDLGIEFLKDLAQAGYDYEKDKQPVVVKDKPSVTNPGGTTNPSNGGGEYNDKEAEKAFREQMRIGLKERGYTDEEIDAYFQAMDNGTSTGKKSDEGSLGP